MNGLACVYRSLLNLVALGCFDRYKIDYSDGGSRGIIVVWPSFTFREQKRQTTSRGSWPVRRMVMKSISNRMRVSLPSWFRAMDLAPGCFPNRSEFSRSVVRL